MSQLDNPQVITSILYRLVTSLAMIRECNSSLVPTGLYSEVLTAEFESQNEPVACFRR